MSHNLIRPFTVVEKMLIANTDDSHIIYNCSQHGVFSRDKDIKEEMCPFSNCSGSIYKIENIDKLREKFKLSKL